MSYYTGVGARSTPNNVLQLMTQIASKLDTMGYILRSGGAKGADSAFERGAITKQIFYAKDATQAAINIAAQLHPKWNACSPFAKRLHGRNAFQVLGPNLNDPSEFLICWTPDGCVRHEDRRYTTGGTGTAISIASTYGVSVHNLSITRSYHDWLSWLG